MAQTLGDPPCLETACFPWPQQPSLAVSLSKQFGAIPLSEHPSPLYQLWKWSASTATPTAGTSPP